MENQDKKIIETRVVKPSMSIWENGIEHRIITPEDESILDESIQKIMSYIQDNDGYGKSDNEKDILYADSQQLWNSLASHLRKVKYTFYINRKQWQFLTDLLKDKLEYDVNTIFFAIELTNLLGSWILDGTNKDDISLKGYTADATETTYMYHIISKHKVKGLTSSTYLFSQILLRIGEISKIINYYDNQAKQLSTDIQKWVASFEDPEEPTDTPEVL